MITTYYYQRFGIARDVLTHNICLLVYQLFRNGETNEYRIFLSDNAHISITTPSAIQTFKLGFAHAFP